MPIPSRKPCKVLYEEFKGIDERQKIKVVQSIAHEAGVQYKDNLDAENNVYEIANQLHLSPESVKDMVAYRYDPDAFAEMAKDQVTKAEKVRATIQQLSTPEGLSRAQQGLKDTFKKIVHKTVSSLAAMPVPESFKEAWRQFGGMANHYTVRWESGLESAEAHTGATEGHVFKKRLNELYEKVTGTKVGLKMEAFGSDDYNLYREAMSLAMSARTEKNEPDFHYLDSLYFMLKQGQKARGPEWGKRIERQIVRANDLLQNKDVLEFIKNEGANLATIREYMISNKIMRADKLPKGYFPNIIEMLNEGAASTDVGRMLFGRAFDAYKPEQAKKYRSGVEAWLNGFEPMNFYADDLMSVYHSHMGRKLSGFVLADQIYKHIDADDWHIKTARDVPERMFYREDPSKDIPRSIDGGRYKNLGLIQKKYNGIMAHPEIFKFMEGVLQGDQHLNKNFAFRTYMRATEALRSVFFSLGCFHAWTLYQKQIELQAGMAMLTKGTENPMEFFVNPLTEYREGERLIEKGDADVLSLVENGMTLHHQQWEQPIFEKYSVDMRTGETKQSLWHNIIQLKGLNTLTQNWIFHNLQPNMKAALGRRICHTDIFKDLVDKHGEKYAYSKVAEIMNNHFGGENLVSLGRSKFAQAFFRATMLAPDFQEAKWKRNLAGFNPSQDPQIRKIYQASLGVEAVMVATVLLVGQQILDSMMELMTGEKHERTAKDWLNDSVGHWMDLRATRAENGRNVYVNIFGSAKEDFRPIASLFSGYLDAMTGVNITGARPKFNHDSMAQKVYLPIAEDLYNEARNKSSPLAAGLIRYIEGKRAPVAKEKDYTMFDLPYMPISAQPAIYSIFGGFADKPEDRAKYLVSSLLLGIAGAPLSEGRTHKAKKTQAEIDAEKGVESLKMFKLPKATPKKEKKSKKKELDVSTSPDERKVKLFLGDREQ